MVAGSSGPNRSASCAAPAISAGDVAEEIRLPLGSRLRPFRRHRRERVAHADQRGVLLDDGDSRRHDAQQRLVHRTQPHDAAGVLGGQEAARDELIGQRPPHRIAPLERLPLDRDDGQRFDPAVGANVTSRTKAVMSAGSSGTALASRPATASSAMRMTAAPIPG